MAWPPAASRTIFPCRRFAPGRIHTYTAGGGDGAGISPQAVESKERNPPPGRPPAQPPIRTGPQRNRSLAAVAVAAVEAAAVVSCDSGRRGFSCWPRRRRRCDCDTKRRGGGHAGNGIVVWWRPAAAGRRGQGAAQVDAPAARPLRARRGPARRRRQ
jgi:hypothetical protein